MAILEYTSTLNLRLAISHFLFCPDTERKKNFTYNFTTIPFCFLTNAFLATFKGKDGDTTILKDNM